MSSSWSEPTDFVVRNAARYTLHAEEDWAISVATPPKFFAGDGPWPAVYVVDSVLTFLPAAQAAQHTLAASGGHLRPIAVVGIGPATRDVPRLMTQRNRDLTPTSYVPAHMEDQTPYGTGGAPDMFDLIVNEVVPFLEARYPLDPDDRALGGLSLGGLFACWALLTRPGRFRRYLAVSPSLWWDGGVVAHMPCSAAAGTSAYLAVGGNEDDPDHAWPPIPDEMKEAIAGINMVADCAAFADRLAQEGVDVHAEVIRDEYHATVWAAAVTRGIVHLYKQ